jgi:hypothetical protein
MSRDVLFAALSLLISLAIVHGYLWVQGIKPSKRNGLWEYMTWEIFPKDKQTAYYLRQRLIAGIVVLPTTLLLLNVLFEGRDSVLYQAFVPRF